MCVSCIMWLQSKHVTLLKDIEYRYILGVWYAYIYILYIYKMGVISMILIFMWAGCC